MALQGSGAIKFSELQTEYGGSHPISLSEYYRLTDNSGQVLHSATVGSSSWVGPTGASTSNSWFQTTVTSGASTGYHQYMQAGGTNVGSTSSYTSGNSRWTTGGGVYYDVTTSDSAKTPTYTRVQRSSLFYYAYTTTYSTTYYNANVPASSTIAMSNFHAGNNP